MRIKERGRSGSDNGGIELFEAKGTMSRITETMSRDHAACDERFSAAEAAVAEGDLARAATRSPRSPRRSNAISASRKASSSRRSSGAPA